MEKKLTTLKAMVRKDNGEGVVMIGDAMFSASREKVATGSLVLVVNPVLALGEYSEGDIFRVLKVDEEANGNVWVNKEKAYEEGHIYLYTEEFTVLEPMNFEALIMALTMEAGTQAPEDVEEEDEDEDLCEGCPNYDDCHSDGFSEEELDDIFDEYGGDLPIGLALVEALEEAFGDDMDALYGDDEEIPEKCIDCPWLEECFPSGDGYDEEDDTDEDVFDLENGEIDEEDEIFLTEIGILPMTQKFLLGKAKRTLEAYGGILDYEGEEAVIEYTELDDAVVVAMIKRHEDGKVLSMGFAQCSPDDEYFEEIGKVIALLRAADEPIPNVLMHFATYPTR